MVKKESGHLCCTHLDRDAEIFQLYRRVLDHKLFTTLDFQAPVSPSLSSDLLQPGMR